MFSEPPTFVEKLEAIFNDNNKDYWESSLNKYFELRMDLLKQGDLDHYKKQAIHKALNVHKLDEEDRLCPICREDLLEHTSAVKTHCCKRIFGEECLQTWLDSSEVGLSGNCPMCRGTIEDNVELRTKYDIYTTDKIFLTIKQLEINNKTPQLHKSPFKLIFELDIVKYLILETLEPVFHEEDEEEMMERRIHLYRRARSLMKGMNINYYPTKIWAKALPALQDQLSPIDEATMTTLLEHLQNARDSFAAKVLQVLRTKCTSRKAKPKTIELRMEEICSIPLQEFEDLITAPADPIVIIKDEEDDLPSLILPEDDDDDED